MTTVRRLILFDIDGTLVRGGPAKTAFLEAMAETYGTVDGADRVSFAGKTDPQIAREILAVAGLSAAEIDAGFPSLWSGYLARLRRALASHPMTVLPGVHDVLEGLAGLEGVALGLLTGNIVGGAELKLGSAGLWSRFAIGSYGSDHEERDELPAIALRRARERWGDRLGAEHALIVGDTPRDVACGRAGRMRTLGVATGMFSVGDLRAAGADEVLEDLSDVERVVELLTA